MANGFLRVVRDNNLFHLDRAVDGHYPEINPTPKGCNKVYVHYVNTRNISRKTGWFAELK